MAEEEGRPEGEEERAAKAGQGERAPAVPEVTAGGASEPAGSSLEEAPAEASAELQAILEALIFASPEPLTPRAIGKLLDTEPKEDILAALAGLKEEYDRPGGLQLVEVAGGYQIVTRPDLHDWVRRLFHERSSQRLSVQALETLAVIAYRQPITAVEVAEIRGVNTSGVLNTLLERRLVKIVGRKQVVGRPFLYATTKEFLIRFGLNDLADLPKVEDMAEALGFDPGPLLVEKTPIEEMLPLGDPEDDPVGRIVDEPPDDESPDDEPTGDEPSDDEPSDDEPGDDEPSDDEPSGSVH